MPNIQKVPGKGELKKYLNAGLTQAQIVEAWQNDSGEKCSRSAIAMAISRYGLKSSTSRPRHAELLPWSVAEEHIGDAEARLLRHEARRRSGKPLREKDEQWLDSWLSELTSPTQEAPLGYVVAYDRGEGFRWRPREPWHTDIIDPPTETRAG